jgi:SAM-dependent methyltransferase
LACKSCNQTFLISEGILYLYEKLSQTAEKEKESNEREMRECRDALNFRNENWLLNFPDVPKMGMDERSERIIRLIAENTDLSLKKYVNVQNAHILEIGAGNCWVTAKLSKDNYCIALDILTKPPYGLESGDVFIKNRNIYFERISADMNEMPFKDNIFDFVVISSSLHHSYRPEKTLNEISRILKTGGQLVLLNEPSRGLFGGKERRQIEIEIANNINEKRYSINEWYELFLNCGYKAQILLPENLKTIFRSKGGIYKYIDILLGINLIRKLMEKFLSRLILFIFDGYFNAILIKKNQNNNVELEN